MTKRKREEEDNIEKRKIEKTKIFGNIPKKLEYYCHYHSHDPEICKMYECVGYRDKEIKEKKDYLN
jgi:hypothetical protein